MAGYAYDPNKGYVTLNMPQAMTNNYGGGQALQNTARQSAQSDYGFYPTSGRQQQTTQTAANQNGNYWLQNPAPAPTEDWLGRFTNYLNSRHNLPAVSDAQWNPTNKSMEQLYYRTPDMMSNWQGRTMYNNQFDQLRNGKVYNYEGREINNVPAMYVDNFMRMINHMNGI